MKNTHAFLILSLMSFALGCGAPEAPSSDRNALTNGGTVVSTGGSTTFTLSPGYSRVAPGAAIQFLAAGGVGPFSYSIVSGGGSINPSTGDFVAASAIGVSQVRVLDAMGNVATAQVEVALTVTLSPITQSIQVGQTLTLTASGGQAPYNFNIESGAGTLGSVGAYSTIFNASSTTGVTVIRATDSLGNSATSRITVQALTPISVTPSTSSMFVNSSINFTVNGGIAPYTYAIIQPVPAVGTVYATGVYQSGANPGNVQIRVTDSAGQIATIYLNVVYNQSSSAYNYSVGTLVDAYLGVTLDNFGTEGYPTLIFYGTGPSLNASSLGHNGNSSCFIGANVSSPCVTRAPLQNINRNVPASSIYVGSLSFRGRNGNASAEFCIEPGNNNRAYLRMLSGSGFGASLRFDQAGRRMIDGRMQAGAIISGLDTSGGAGNVQVAVSTARYISGTSCSAYNSIVIEAQP